MQKWFRLAIGTLAVILVGVSYLRLEGAELQGTARLVSPGAGQAPASQTVAVASSDVETYRAVLDEYCVTCHSDTQLRLGRIPVSLQTVALQDPSGNAEVWEKVIRKLRAGLMPPPGSPRPDQATYNAIVAYLETSIDRSAADAPNPGRRESLYRLTRAEYGNAIRDLLALEIDVAPLLPEDAANRHGFDNMASELRLSPTLLDRYLSAAYKISRLAVGIPPRGPVVNTYTVPLLLDQEFHLGADAPLGSRGGLALRHHFPVDGEYEIRIHLQTNYVGYVRGIYAPHQFELRLDGTRIEKFTIGGEATGTPAPWGFEGNIFGSDEWEHYAQHVNEDLVVRLPVQAGPRLLSVTFPRERWAPDGVLQRPLSGYPLAIKGFQDHNPALSEVEITGPFAVTGPGDTPSREKIFVCRPADSADEESCATRIFSRLARMAYRRPVTDADLSVVMEFFRQRRETAGFDAGIQGGLERILAAPEFLFRIERDPADIQPDAVYQLSDLEVASRLSSFLWSSLPDEELLNLTERGELAKPEVLDQQVRRMIADARSTALVDNFFGQWLRIRELDTLDRDPVIFPEWGTTLREALRTETDLFLDYQLREDRPVTELVGANYTFLNERLAKHYDIPKVYGSRFRRVALSDSDRRGGVLGHGSLLAVTSYPRRTSPVLRGHFLLDRIVGSIVPPPPPDVPALPTRDENGPPASVRDLLESHRANPVCATCHSQMDPFGFGLENFDAVGAWRTSDGGAPVDATGQLLDGTAFEGLSGLREVLLSRPDQFVHAVAEKLLTYALGREIQHFDMPAVRAIVRAAASEEYRWSAIILNIVRSDPFQMRTSAPADSSPGTSVAARR